MLSFKDLMERINETRSFYLEEENLFEGPTHLEYSGHVGEKEYAVKVPRHKDLGDYSEKDLHHKISKENPHLHHHEVTAIVNSGGEEESHEKVEHEGKTHTHHVINYQEPRHLYEEVEGLDEANRKYENFDSNSKAHQAAKKATKGYKAKHSKATYHPDGTATITTHGELPEDPTGKSGDISKQIERKSHHVVNAHLRSAGGTHGMTADETDGHKEKLNGVNWKVKEKSKSSYFKGGSHEIHLSEEVEGLHEISAMRAIRTSVKREVSGVNKSMETGDPDDAGQKKIDKNKERIHKKYGYRAANIAHNAAGKKLDYVDGPYQPRKRKYMEEVDFDLFESIMLGEGDLSIRTLYNKYADHALGAGDKPEPKKAAAVKKAITKVHGSTVMGHLEKAKNAAAKNDQDSERHHFNAARNSAKTDTMGATVGKGRSSMRKEDVDLDEGRMEDLAMDMESLSHADFKKKHRRSKQEMQDALKSEELKGNQHKIDANKNGKVDGHDFKILRNAKKARYQ